MRKSIFLLLGLIIFTFSVSALTVELLEPSPGQERVSEINNIQFKCNATGALGVKLFTNIGGNWEQTENTIFGNGLNNGIAEFLVPSFPEGTFIWNCFANDAFWAEANFTFTFRFPENNPPECTGSFPNIELEKNTPKYDVLNLNDYFSDSDPTDVLEFKHLDGSNGVSGTTLLVITIKNSGFIDLEPVAGKTGPDDNIHFWANDGEDEKQCGPLTVTITDPGDDTPVENNTAPEITPSIPDQTKELDVSSWTLNLNNYVEDDGDKSSLTWTIEGEDSDIVEIVINDVSKKATFEPVGEGESTVTFVVTDGDGLSDEEDVIINIVSADGDDEEDIEEDTTPLNIESHTPGSSDPELGFGDTLSFFINLNKVGASFTWYVDGSEVKSGVDLDNFDFEPESMGGFIVSVIVEKDGESDEYAWDVTVGEAVIALESGSDELCGNGVVDSEETCESCPEDVVCREGEECTSEGCLAKSEITGFAVKGIPTNAKIGIAAVIIIVILFAILIIRARNKSKIKDKKLTSFGGKQEVGSIKKPEGEKKGIGEILKEKREGPSGVEPIIGFIQSGLASGDSEKGIKKALLKSGWNRKQVKIAFKSLKK